MLSMSAKTHFTSGHSIPNIPCYSNTTLATINGHRATTRREDHRYNEPGEGHPRATQGQKHIRVLVKQESPSNFTALTNPVVIAGNTQPEEEDDYDFERTRKSMDRPIYELRQIDEMKPEDIKPADKIRQAELRLMVVRALLNWIPNVHSIALQANEDAEMTESSLEAHKCLLFAVNTMHTVESLGECYDIEDLEYNRHVRLLSSKNTVIHSWRSVTGYDPFRIILWIWRDICLSILSREDNNVSAEISEEKAGVVISRMLNDIRLCIPLDAYNFREKKAKRNPTYWSLGFVYSMHRLEQLYVSCRLNELQNHPSYDLYTSIKNSLPENYKSQALTVVQNISHTQPTLNGRIDIFTYERCTKELKKLIDKGLLKRDTVRFRNIILPYSHDKSPAVAKWAYDQVVKGFQEAVDNFYAEILELFPEVNRAVLLEQGKQMHRLEEFLASARGDKDVEMEVSDPARGEPVEWIYTFRGYHNIVRDWFWGRPTSQGLRLRTQVKDIFVAKLGFLLMYDKFVGKALKNRMRAIQRSESQRVP
ncbi:uncharacterized protein H6S33_007272 [Morchella sextelata]|uniref:uncharacterized protein n=1 Tax=Morchella sextelata TaxID=1174677 RepID=UPI001D053C12|nr:uncharacterized protein H6S33_007272 [Morchella sextelata]KAH0603613.1 hypothetical protein H6S33_007272 [Morchella sextelata]